jgi:hypothetical protein
LSFHRYLSLYNAENTNKLFLELTKYIDKEFPEKKESNILKSLEQELIKLETEKKDKESNENPIDIKKLNIYEKTRHIIKNNCNEEDLLNLIFINNEKETNKKTFNLEFHKHFDINNNFKKEYYNSRKNTKENCLNKIKNNEPISVSELLKSEFILIEDIFALNFLKLLSIKEKFEIEQLIAENIIVTETEIKKIIKNTIFDLFNSNKIKKDLRILISYLDDLIKKTYEYKKINNIYTREENKIIEFIETSKKIEKIEKIEKIKISLNFENEIIQHIILFKFQNLLNKNKITDAFIFYLESKKILELNKIENKTIENPIIEEEISNFSLLNFIKKIDFFSEIKSINTQNKKEKEMVLKFIKSKENKEKISLIKKEIENLNEEKKEDLILKIEKGLF